MITTKSDHHQYDKSDGFYCGQIHPEHISPSQGIKLKLVAHNTESEECSGFAWFDYVSLAPGIINGKINVNTASAQVLSALNGLTPKIARNLAAGSNASGQNKLKPYKNITDILDVNGMTPDLFRKISNCVTTRSDQYRIQIITEIIDDVDNNGIFNSDSGDKILAHIKRDVLADRSELTDDDPNTSMFKCTNIK